MKENLLGVMLVMARDRGFSESREYKSYDCWIISCCLILRVGDLGQSGIRNSFQLRVSEDIENIILRVI